MHQARFIRQAIFYRTIVASTWSQLDHNGFAIISLLALLHPASYALRVPRLPDSLHTSFPHSVALMQLCFTSLTVVSSQEDIHLQDGAHVLTALGVLAGAVVTLAWLGAAWCCTDSRSSWAFAKLFM